MLTVQLPIPFLKALYEKEGYIQVWVKWISVYGEKVKDPFFIDWLNKTEKPLPEVLEKLKPVYEFGKPYMEGICFSKLKTGKITKKQKSQKDHLDKVALLVLNYLNLKLGSAFGRVRPESAIKPIVKILGLGYTKDDCVTVINKKYEEWYGNEVMQRHLVPDTLFREEKFDTYLNQPIKHAKTGGQSGRNIQKVTNDVDEAIAFNEQMVANKAGTADNQGY